MCCFFSMQICTMEDILFTESEDFFREAVEADSVENVTPTDPFISRVSFMDTIESIGTRLCYFWIHVEYLYLFLHRSNRRPCTHRCRWLSSRQGIFQGSCWASLYKPEICICVSMNVQRMLWGNSIPTFMFTDSADNILLAGQAKHFISRISVKEAVDLAYSVQIRPSFAAYTHWAIIFLGTHISVLVAPTSSSKDPAEDTLLAELDDSLIRFSRALFNEMSETVCGVQIRKDYKQFIHILTLYLPYHFFCRRSIWGSLYRVEWSKFGVNWNARLIGERKKIHRNPAGIQTCDLSILARHSYNWAATSWTHSQT